jgi:enterochelin esterase family protein
MAAAGLLAVACDSDSDSNDTTTPPVDTVWTFEQFLAQAETTAANDRALLVDSFLTYWSAIAIPPVHVAPDSEFGTAAFVLTSTANSATVAGDFNGWNPSADPMQRLNGTILFYLVKRFEKNARFDYKFVTNGNNWMLDPRNPRIMPGGFGANSQMWMPAFTPPVEAAADTSIAHGTSQTFSIHSDIMNNTRTVTVYLPAGYDTTQDYRVLYTHDGPDYRNFLRIHNIADYLIGHNEVAPFIVATVPWASPPGREGEYHMNANFARFFTEELIPYMDSHFATLAAPEGRAIAGESSAGLGAVYLAWARHEYFRWAIGQSGYYSWNGDALLDSISAAPTRDVRFYLEVGTYETNMGGGVNLVTAQERLAAVLQQKGYVYESLYFPDGHSWGNWQAAMPDAIRWMWQ